MRRPIIFVLLAGFAALVAALVVYSALKKREAQVQEAMAQSVNIVVAAKDLPLGTKIDADSVRLARWSKDAIPVGALTDPSAIMGNFVKSSMVQNEPITQDRLFGGDKTAGVLPLLIPAGMRALSVPVNEVSDIAGFVLPHTHVDVVVSVTGGEGTAASGQPFSKIVLQNVEVLAVAQEVEQTNDQPQVVKVVTFLVTPEEAERLTLASHEGALRLAMRNYSDSKIVMTNGVTVAQMLRAYGSPQAAAPVMHLQHIARAPRPKPISVEVLRDGKSSESISFIKANGGTPAPASDAAPGSSSKADSTYIIADSVTEEGAPAPAAPKVRAARSLAAGAPLDAGPAVGVVSSTGTIFDGPDSRTIDVPEESNVSGGPAIASDPINAPASAAGSGESGGVAGTAAGFNGPKSKTIDVP